MKTAVEKTFIEITKYIHFFQSYTSRESVCVFWLLGKVFRNKMIITWSTTKKSLWFIKTNQWNQPSNNRHSPAIFHLFIQWLMANDTNDVYFSKQGGRLRVQFLSRPNTIYWMASVQRRNLWCVSPKENSTSTYNEYCHWRMVRGMVYWQGNQSTNGDGEGLYIGIDCWPNLFFWIRNCFKLNQSPKTERIHIFYIEMDQSPCLFK